MLAKETQEQQGGDEESGMVKKGPYIKAGAVAHAASVIPDDFKNLKVPLSLVCVEDDPLFPNAVRSAGEDAMTDANLEHEVQVYPGVPHGKLTHAPGDYNWNVRTTSADYTPARFRRRGRIPRHSHQRRPGHGLRADAKMDPEPLTHTITIESL